MAAHEKGGKKKEKGKFWKKGKEKKTSYRAPGQDPCGTGIMDWTVPNLQWSLRALASEHADSCRHSVYYPTLASGYRSTTPSSLFYFRSLFSLCSRELYAKSKTVQKPNKTRRFCACTTYNQNWLAGKGIANSKCRCYQISIRENKREPCHCENHQTSTYGRQVRKASDEGGKTVSGFKMLALNLYSITGQIVISTYPSTYLQLALYLFTQNNFAI